MKSKLASRHPFEDTIGLVFYFTLFVSSGAFLGFVLLLFVQIFIHSEAVSQNLQRLGLILLLILSICFCYLFRPFLLSRRISKNIPEGTKVQNSRQPGDLPNLGETFITHQKKTIYAILASCLLFLGAFILFSIIILDPRIVNLLSRGSFFAWGPWSFIAIFLIIILFVAFINLYIPIRNVKVDREGVHNNRSHISWDQMTCFIRHRYHELFGARITLYELFGEGKGVYWWQLHTPHRCFAITKPTINQEEYHEKMQLLIEYICKRTGLPLYDLSGPESIQVYPPLEHTLEQAEGAVQAI